MSLLNCKHAIYIEGRMCHRFITREITQEEYDAWKRKF